LFIPGSVVGFIKFVTIVMNFFATIQSRLVHDEMEVMQNIF